MSNIIVLFEVTVKSGKMDDYLKMAKFCRTPYGTKTWEDERFCRL